MTAVDHLVFACPELDEGVRLVEELLGVASTEGGRHEGLGTRNRLVRLGPRTYLEIVGPDRDQAAPVRPRWFGIDALPGPRLVTWAAPAPAPLDEVVRRAAAAGVDLGAVRPAARRRPDGTELRWTFTEPGASRLDGIVPFFIDWSGSEHPAASLPVRCALLELAAEHPDEARCRAALSAVDVDLVVAPGPAPRLRARIEAPNGVVELG